MSLSILVGWRILSYEYCPCRESNELRTLILKNLSSVDGETLRMSKSIADPACPDIFSYRQENRLIQATSWDVINGKLPRQPNSGEQVCTFNGLHLPNHYKLLAAFAPMGRENFSFVDSNYPSPSSNEVDVVAGAPGPVVLMLLDYLPTVWNIKASKQTQLLAVFADSAHRQWIQGVDAKLPTFISAADDGGTCGWLFESGAQEDVDATAKHLFGRPTDRTYRPKEFKGDTIYINDGV